MTYNQINMSTPPNGWIRIGPNFVLAKPRILLASFLLVQAGKIYFNLKNLVPETARFLLLDIAQDVKAKGYQNSDSGGGINPLYDDNTETGYTSFIVITETVTQSLNTSLGVISSQILCPINSNFNITLNVTPRSFGTTLYIHSLNIIGYYD